MSEGLNDKQLAFVEQYMIDRNAAQAAIRAGYSERSARQIGYQLLTKVDIKQAIIDKTNEVSSIVGIDQIYVLSELYEMSELDYADIMNDDGSYKAVKDWPKEWRLNVSSFEIEEFYDDEGNRRTVKKIKKPDRKTILDQIGKHVEVNAWTERKELHHSGIPQSITANVNTAPLDAGTQAVIEDANSGV